LIGALQLAEIFTPSTNFEKLRIATLNFRLDDCFYHGDIRDGATTAEFPNVVVASLTSTAARGRCSTPTLW
jgi:hypothetical protein